VGRVELCCQPDARRRLQVQAGEGQKCGVGQRVGPRQLGAAAAGQAERPRLAPALRDAIGKGGGQQQARVAPGNTRRHSAHPQPALVGCGLAPDAADRPAVHVAATTSHGVQPELHVCRGIPAAQGVALLQQRRKLRRAGRLFRTLGGQHHRGQARMGAQRRHAVAVRGNAAVRVDGAQAAQQLRRGGQRPGGRRVGEGQIGGRRAPGGAVQQQAGQLGLQDVRPVIGRQAAVQRRGPQPDGDARRLPARASAALVGGGAADAQGGQAGQPRRLVQPRGAPPAAIDDDADAGHGQGGLGDAGGQHDAAPLRRTQGAVLVGGRQVAVQRQHEGAAPGQGSLGPADLAHAGQEGQDVALVGRQGSADGAGQGLRQVAHVGDVAGGVLDLDGEHAAGALDHRGVEQGGQPGTVQGGRHRQQAQLRAQHPLQVQAQRQGEVGLQGALVHLVQQHGGDAVQGGVAVQAADQQPLGHDLDAGTVGYGAVQACAVADALAHRLAEQVGHAGRGGAGGKAARLQHQDAPVATPGGVQQGQRHKGGLAGAGRRDQHGIAAAVQRCQQGGQGFGYGEVGEHGAKGVAWPEPDAQQGNHLWHEGAACCSLARPVPAAPDALQAGMDNPAR